MKRTYKIALLAMLLSIASNGIYAEGLTMHTNTWVRSSTSNALASNPANWSLKHVPTENEIVRLPASNPRSIIWDEAAPDTVGGWLQEAGYLAIATIATSRDGVIKELHIKGDCFILDGGLTHHPNSDEDKWWLNLKIDGNMSIGERAFVSTSGKGFASGKGPSPGIEPGHGASHGGQGSTKIGGDFTNRSLCYDSIINPTQSGSGGTTKEGGNYSYNGGGVIMLKIAGNLTHNGVICSNADSANIDGTNWGGAAGGTINIDINGHFYGEGKIQANGGRGWHNGAGGGGGGRIAIVYNKTCKGDGEGNDPSNFPTRQIVAYGGVGETNSPDNPSQDKHVRAACGTVYLENRFNTNIPGGGNIIIRDWQRSTTASTRIPSDICDNPLECKDAAIHVHQDAFVTLTSTINIRALIFYGANGLDLNNNYIYTGIVKDDRLRKSLSDFGTYDMNNYNDIFGSVIFNNGAIVIQTYLKPIL